MKKANRKGKDTVFRMLYSDRKRALSLYNGVNGTDYANPSELQFNTLENAIFMNVKNDLSFILADQLNLYEHQSSISANMPLRDLFYCADILQKLYFDKTIYSSKAIMIPSPKFIVFYNGREALPERMEFRLSDHFMLREKEPSLELKVTLLNINPGMNEELKERCPSLREYMQYVERVREYAEDMETDAAVERAVDECIAEGILEEFLQNQKAEVVKMSIYEYDEERELKLIREDERELGREEGREEGESYFAQLAEKLLADLRMDDLIKATKDREFRLELYREYHIL